jgi:hypothetical protein
MSFLPCTKAIERISHRVPSFPLRAISSMRVTTQSLPFRGPQGLKPLIFGLFFLALPRGDGALCRKVPLGELVDARQSGRYGIMNHLVVLREARCTR